MSTRTRSTLSSILATVWVLPALLATVACSGKNDPKTLPTQTSTQVSPQLEPPPQLPPPIRRVRPTHVPTVKVIDPGDPDDEPTTLYEASELAKARKAEGQQRAVAEITDENLHELAAQADVIILEGDPDTPPPTAPGADSATGRSATEGERGEEYWRNGVLERRMGWRRATDRIQELELESAALRQQFYAEEDPYVRDNQIKPAWDRVLDLLSQQRQEYDHNRQDLDQFVERGRQAGALPGWLGEGLELEPETSQDDAQPFSAHKAMNPPTTSAPVKNPGGG